MTSRLRRRSHPRERQLGLQRAAGAAPITLLLSREGTVRAGRLATAEISARRLVISAAEQLVLAAPILDLRATDVVRVGAPRVEVQATAGDVDLRAEGDIALDGELVKLNSSPAPQPFVWSTPPALARSSA